MRRILLIATSVTAAFVAAVAVFVLTSLPPAAIRLPSAADRGQVVWGAYHVHSAKSDGSGTVEEIAAAASRAGLTFVILTDHGDATRPLDPPRYIDGVLCIDAVEINSESGHVVALNLQQVSPYPIAGEARDVIEDIHRLGGMAVIAHPESPRAGLGWRGPTTGADGIEWLNVDSEWRARSSGQVAASALRALVRGPESIASLFQPPRRSLNRWNEMQQRRPAFTVAATDAHARLGGEQGSRGPGALRFPSYESLFRTVVQVVSLGAPLTHDAATDARELLLALGAGQSYSVVRAFADVVPAIEFTAVTPVGRVDIGRQLPAGVQASFHLSSPVAGVRLDLLKDGTVVQRGPSPLEFTAADARGIYRAEAYLPGHVVPWVVTNAIYLDRARGSQPVPSPAPAPATSASVFPIAPGAFVLERDASSTATIAADAAGTVLSYRLGAGAPAGQYVALAASSSEQPVDRIEFAAQGDRPMRVSLQVRVPGGQRWRNSLYVDTTPRSFSVALSELEPVDRRSPLRPVVAKIQSVLIVIDTVNTLPGQSGMLTVAGLRLIQGLPAPATGK